MIAVRDLPHLRSRPSGWVRPLAVSCALLSGTAFALAQPPEAVTPQAEPAPTTIPAGARPAAAAPARVVVVPIVVAHGPVPEAALLDALGAGLAANPAWRVAVGKKGEPLPLPGGEVVDAAALDGVHAALERLREGTPEARWDGLIALREELEALGQRRRFDARARALYLTVADALIQVALLRGDQGRAKEVADRVALVMPGRHPGAPDGLSVVAAALIASASPEATAMLKLVSQPPGCALTIDGVEQGISVVEVPVLPGQIYELRASCPPAQGGGVAARWAKGPESGKGRIEVLDADFETALHNDADGTWLQFVSSAARAELEPVYARRVAEKLDADVVVFVSAGEMAGTAYLNGRAYLRSGFRNRQGLARVGVEQSRALGRYLATGHDPRSIILRPEDTAKLAPVADLTVPSAADQRDRDPWYTDGAGWGLTGGGLVAMALGFYFEDEARDLRRQAKQASRDGNPFLRDRLQSRATDMDFLAGIGLLGGGLMVVTGVVLLALPEYRTSGELFVLRPSLGATSAGLSLSGRF